MMSVEQSVEWKLAGKTEVLGLNLPKTYFVHYRSHMTWPGIESDSPWWKTGAYAPALRHECSVSCYPSRQNSRYPYIDYRKAVWAPEAVFYAPIENRTPLVRELIIHFTAWLMPTHTLRYTTWKTQMYFSIKITRKTNSSYSPNHNQRQNFDGSRRLHEQHAVFHI
jgi:hypothetical protein